MINKYTYNKRGVVRKKNGTGHRYLCSSYEKKSCKAYAHVSDHGFIIKTGNEHNHLPTQYVKTSRGFFIKV